MKKVILLVDDDESLSQFMKICIEESGSSMELKQVTDTDKAIKYLNNTDEYSDKTKNPDPAFMLLDLGLPKTSGLEFLKIIKSKKEYLKIPVVILTAMESDSTIKEACTNYANSCLIKPFGYDKTKELMKSITKYWGDYNKLPERAE